MMMMVMMMMVMMMKVIMLVFKTSVCRKVTPTQHTECPNTLFCLSSILPVRPHRSRGRTTMRTMTKWRRSRKHPKKIHVTSSCMMMLHVLFFFSLTSFQLHFDFKLSELWEATKCSTWRSGGWWGNTMFSFLGEETESIDLFTYIFPFLVRDKMLRLHTNVTDSVKG